MAIGFSSALSRVFRSLHRSKHNSAEESPRGSASPCVSPSSLVLLAAGTAIALPESVDLPRGFTRHVRHLVDCVALLHKLRAAANPSTRRHAAVVKALDRVASLLRERDDEDTSTRAVPLNAAVELLLIVWECVLQCLEIKKSHPRAASPMSSVSDRLSTCSSSSSTPPDDASRLDGAVRSLLTLLIQQKEFDLALMALGRGDCNAHRHDGTRRRSTHENLSMALRPEREELRLSRRNSRNTRLSRRGSLSTKRPPLPRPMPTKRDVKSTSDTPLCQLAKKYLDLHQTSLRVLQDACSRYPIEAMEDSDKTSDRALLMQFLAVSYVRVPVLRGAILSAFQQSLETNDGRRRHLQERERRVSRSHSLSNNYAPPQVRSRSGTVMDEVNVALFRWTQNLHSRCHASVAPLHREAMWSKEIMQLSVAMADAKFQRVLVAKLIDHFLSLGGNSIDLDWKCLPGAALLKEVVLTMTETVFQSQLRAIEQSLMEKEVATTAAGGAEGSSLKDSDLNPQSYSLATPDDWTVGVFFKQTMRMLASNTPVLYEWLLTVLHNTNYVVSFNVTLCLRYLGQLMAQFPTYFTEDSRSSATEMLLRQVFSTLLKSEHFEVLRNTEMFLMKHFAGFSVSLREALVEIFAVEFKRLFLHWNRDVRFCFYHMLLYLTYPGNRLVLGAKSDELMMGTAAAQLFEIPGLIRHSSHMSAKWDAFDVPLCELISHVNRLTKNTRSPVRSIAASQQPRAQQAAPTRASMSTTRTSMTLRPKPARATLTARASHGRMSLTTNPYAPKNAASSMPKVASMPALPVSLAITPPPPVPAWIQPLSLATMQRSIQEYRRHVETYFSMARQLSVHDAVPTPMLQAAAKA